MDTLLFTHIEGSTKLLQQLPTEFATALSDQRALLRAAFERWNRREIDPELV